MSIQHLIDLASRTGDRLIVHNPIEQQDVVIMSVQEYENLIEDNQCIQTLSSDQMLEKINRDISIWRSDREENEEWQRTMQLEDELWDEEMEDFVPEPWDHSWHRAGDIMGDRHRPILDHSGFDDLYDEFDDEEEDEEDDFDNWEPPRFDSDGNFIVDDIPTDYIGSPFGESGEAEIKVEDIPFGPLADEHVGSWEEEPLPSEEPVFYEEPV